MTEDPIWQPLQAELARWIHANRSAKFWLRDDDAVEPTPALDQLLQLANDFKAPVTLAVIPAHTGEPLAERLGVRHKSLLPCMAGAMKITQPKTRKSRNWGPIARAISCWDSSSKVARCWPNCIRHVLCPFLCHHGTGSMLLWCRHSVNAVLECFQCLVRRPSLQPACPPSTPMLI